MKLALQGVSVLVASGDTGVAGRANVTTGGLGLCLGSNGAIFNPIWPSKYTIVQQKDSLIDLHDLVVLMSPVLAEQKYSLGKQSLNQRVQRSSTLISLWFQEKM